MDDTAILPGGVFTKPALPSARQLSGPASRLLKGRSCAVSSVARMRARIAALEGELRRRQTLAEQTEWLGRIGSWDLDVETATLSWSEGTYRIFGLDPAVPVTLDQTLSFYPDEPRAVIDAMLRKAAESGEPFDFTVPHTTVDGASRWVRAIGQMINDEDGRRRLVGVMRDVTSERGTEERLRYLAGHDPLTGLCNRRTFLERLDAALQTTEGGDTALMLIDIDHFKSVNDLHGHGVGDALLRETARRLRSGVRGTDTVARIGGDEFAVIVEGVQTEVDVEARLNSVVRLFDSPIELASGPFCIGISAGIATSRHRAMNADQLLKDADQALYQAKNLGRGQGFVFTAALGASMEQRLRIRMDVRVALQRDELDIFYQPIMDLRTLAIRGLEALIRWRHPERGALTPAAFLPALADPALSFDIGNFVLANSLRQMRAWIDAGVAAACVNVNVSESQLLRGEELFETVAGLLKQNGLAPDRLKLELLESAFLGRQNDAVAATVARFNQYGVVVALDDFGTGYASLTHLKQFAVGRIKIDQSFMRDLGVDPGNTAITRAIIDLSRSLGLRVTAEGIETKAQLAFLLAAGCDCGQGYLFSRPMPADQVPGFVRRWHNGGSDIVAAARAAAGG